MGHYDECRPGYCEICGQTEGNCEHTKKKIVKENKNFLDSIDELNKFRHENEISVKKSLNYKIWFIADTHFDHNFLE